MIPCPYSQKEYQWLLRLANDRDSTPYLLQHASGIAPKLCRISRRVSINPLSIILDLQCTVFINYPRPSLLKLVTRPFRLDYYTLSTSTPPVISDIFHGDADMHSRKLLSQTGLQGSLIQTESRQALSAVSPYLSHTLMEVLQATLSRCKGRVSRSIQILAKLRVNNPATEGDCITLCI